jgi:hypothetical protein
MASPSFREISQLAALRQRLPVLRTGTWIPLWVDNGDDPGDDGVFAFARASEDGASFVVVAINASDKDRLTGTADHALQLPASLRTAGKVMRPALTIGAGKNPDAAPFAAAGPLWLPVPASSLVVYEAVPAVP